MTTAELWPAVDGVSHPHAFRPKVSNRVETNVFSKSTVISSTTEISLRAWVCFQTFSTAVFSRAHAPAHSHTQAERGESEARALLSEVVFWTRTCRHRGYQRHLLSLTACGLVLDFVGRCFMFISNIACFVHWQHTKKSTHAKRERERCMLSDICCQKLTDWAVPVIRSE